MVNAILDGRRMTTRAAAHDELTRALALPAHYGRNLDALWDALGEVEGRVTLTHTDALLEALGAYGAELIKTLYDAARDNPGLEFGVVDETQAG